MSKLNEVHTPTPWSVQECDEIWCDTDGRPNAPLFKPDAQYRRWGREVNREQREANAAFIVHAVNSHATLTAALEEARGALEASRSFVELAYEETDGEEAADAKIVMGQTDAALATINAALEGLQ